MTGTERSPLLSWIDRLVPRRLRFLVGLALVMTVATGIVSAWESLPLRDPDDALGPSWLRLPGILLVAVLIDVLPRIVRRWRAGLALGTSVRRVLAERWTPAQLRFSLVGLGSWYLTYVAFRNLKNAVPFVRDGLWDAQMADLDRVLWLGHDPGAVLHAVFGTGAAASFFAFVYLLWIGLIPASLAWALAWTRDHALAAWLVTALALDWAIGVAAYFAWPTLGPIYSESADFAALPASSTWLQEQMMLDRHEVLANPSALHTLQTIAAFPSLHVGMMVTLCLVVQAGTRQLLARGLCWAMLALTCLATIYLGWHFFVDVLGGAVVGAVAVWLAALVTGRRFSLRPPG